MDINNSLDKLADVVKQLKPTAILGAVTELVAFTHILTLNG